MLKGLNLTTILPHLSNIIICLDLDIRIIEFNVAAEQFYKCKKQEVIGLNYFDFLQTQNIEPRFLLDIQALVQNGIQEQTYSVSFGADEKHTVSWKILPFYVAKDTLQGIVFIGTDITREKVTESAIKTIGRRLESVIESIAGNHWWKDVNGYYMGCNDTVVKLLGLSSPLEIIGKTDYDLPWADMANELVKNDQEVIQSGLPQRKEEHALTKDGRILTFLVTKVPLRDEYGNIIGTIGTSVDITEQKSAQIQLQIAKEKAERASQVIKIFAESIAHELRTPLASLNGQIYGIDKYLPTFVDGYYLAKASNLPVKSIRSSHHELLLKCVENMQMSLKHANSIIEMILFRANPSKLDSENLKLCSIKKCVQTALLQYPFSPKERLLVFWEDVYDFSFFGEELFAVHVLFNLIKNALYYVAKMNKGKIYIWVELSDEFNYLHFKDTSKGISKQELPKIFNDYFSNTPHGTGIGLAFCKQVMSIFSGNIKCCSVEGEYTEFILQFPNVEVSSSKQ